MPPKAKVFNLYIDESGDFNEKEGKTQEFANQIGGILVAKEKLDEDRAESILKDSYKVARYHTFPENSPVHGLNLKPGQQYDRLIDSLVSQIEQHKWQPVRIVNLTSVNYGNKTENYVNMLAELILSIFQQESKKAAGRITINIYCASVLIRYKRKNKQVKTIIKPHQYLQAIKNYLAFAAVRLGLAEESSLWRIGAVDILEAKDSRRLQLCDLLNNASHNNYRKSGDETANKLKEAFGIYDRSLVTDPLTEKCRLLDEKGLWGLIIREIAEDYLKQLEDCEQSSDIREFLDDTIAQLANTAATDRDSHLNILLDWLKQIVNQQRSIDLGDRLVQWLKEKVYFPLSDRLEPQDNSISWFAYGLHFWSLTIANHKGELLKAREETSHLIELRPNISGQWEKVPLLMEGLIAEAVHHTDCWEYYEATKCMHSVVKYYQDLSSLFDAALPSIFPKRVRSELQAKALGTWLQSEIHTSSFLPHRVSLARSISDVSMRVFPGRQDRQRQYQYRAQLETLAGNYQTARKYLARSINIADATHDAIAKAIKTLDTIPQGFALLHWLRLGVTAYLSNCELEWSEFLNAWNQSKLIYNNWCQGKQSTHYPTHGILRRVALINEIQNRPDAAVGRLRKLNSGDTDNIVLEAIQVATYAEVAAINWVKQNEKAKKLLDDEKKNSPGILQLTQELSAKSEGTFPRFHCLTQLWTDYLQPALDGGSEAQVKENLIKIGTTVNY